ncbi:uncharacterized protein TNCV_4301651 [Trichonephila clavipes]|uniref:Uncharacterized protein n=1 Tax=Trichonephila clavipes TaxID=2585209 RepID=A0A8X6RR29_TRICX|nr:uncharacterized protein TNCV_4301651 [Trichonephila clavipes]
MFDSSKPDDDVVNFVSKLKSHMQSLHPKPPKHHGKRPVFIHPGLLEATHVFLRRDMLRRPLQQPYDGRFKVLQRKDKVFSLTSMNETPATVEPNPTPATVEHDPTASTPTQPSTRSGRKVHLPFRGKHLRRIITAHNSLLQREPEDGALDVLSPGGTKTSADIDFCPPTCLFRELGLRNNTGKRFRANSWKRLE